MNTDNLERQCSPNYTDVELQNSLTSGQNLYSPPHAQHVTDAFDKLQSTDASFLDFSKCGTRDTYTNDVTKHSYRDRSAGRVLPLSKTLPHQTKRFQMVCESDNRRHAPRFGPWHLCDAHHNTRTVGEYCRTG